MAQCAYESSDGNCCCDTCHYCCFLTGEVCAEVYYRMSVIVFGLEVGVVPHPSVVAHVTPSAVYEADPSFPSVQIPVAIYFGMVHDSHWTWSMRTHLVVVMIVAVVTVVASVAVVSIVTVVAVAAVVASVAVVSIVTVVVVAAVVAILGVRGAFVVVMVARRVAVAKSVDTCHHHDHHHHYLEK